MKKILTLALASSAVFLTAMSKDFLIELASGDQVRISTDEIEDIRFDATPSDVNIPDDPYPSATDFSRKILLMEHTGTKCGYCPIMVDAIHALEADPEYSDAFTLAAVHGYNGDPMGSPLIREISDKYNTSKSFPFTSIDFKTTGVGAYSFAEKTADMLREAITAEYTDVAPAGIAASATLTDSSIDLTLVMKAAEDGQYRVGAFLIEDGIQAPQLDFSKDTEEITTHNNVVRTIVGRDSEGGFTGIDLGTVHRAQTAYSSQTINLAQGWNLEKCRLLIYVTQKIGDRYICVNSAYAAVDGDTGFSYDSENPATDSYVTLSKSLVQLSAEGGASAVDFTLAAGASAGKIAIDTTVDWIKNVKVEGSQITFSVDPNSGEKSRTGRISLSYDGARPIDISVRQNSKADDAKGLFTFSVDVLTPYSVSATITPNGYDGNYFFLVVKAATIDTYINAGNLQGWIDGDLEWIRAQAEYNEMDIETFLPLFKQAYQTNGQPVTMTYSNLDADTEYYVYAYGLSTKGEVTTDFYKQKFVTSMVNKVNLTFSADITNISENSAEIKVIPSDNENSYFWTYVSEMDWAKYDLNFIMDNMIKNIMTNVANGYDINTMIHKGPSSETPNTLWKGTKYYLVGWGMDEQGTATTEPVNFANFTTLSQAVTDDCTFSIDCPEVKDNDILIHVKPSKSSTRYYVAAVDQELCAGYNDEQMAQRLINMEDQRFSSNFYGDGINWGNAEWVLTGEQSKWGRKDLEWTFSPYHTYNIYVFGVDAKGNRTTAVAKKVQQTADPRKSDMKIDIELTDATWDYGTFTFKPSNDDEYYIPLLFESSELKYITNPDGSLNEAIICAEIEEYYDHSPNYYTHRGEFTQKFRWISDRDYTMLVCGWSGGNTTEFFRYDCHTPEIGLGEGKGDVECKWELFDANELMGLDYNRWKDYVDCVVIRLQFEPNADATYYCGGIWMPKETYADVGEIDYLITLDMNPDVSVVNRRSAMFRTLAYGVTYSLSYFAKDKDDKFGPFHYEEFTPTAGKNITAAYDFWSNPSAAPEYVYAISPDGKVKSLPSFKAKPADNPRKAPEKKTESTGSESLGRN